MCRRALAMDIEPGEHVDIIFRVTVRIPSCRPTKILKIGMLRFNA